MTVAGPALTFSLSPILNNDISQRRLQIGLVNRGKLPPFYVKWETLRPPRGEAPGDIHVFLNFDIFITTGCIRDHPCVWVG